MQRSQATQRGQAVSVQRTRSIPPRPHGTFVVTGSAPDAVAARDGGARACWADRPWGSGEIPWSPMMYSVTVLARNLPGLIAHEPAPARATGDVTRILSQIEHGDGHAAEQLLPLVYDELRKLAAAKMAQEKPGQTLQATALVHEAYIRLVDVEQGPALEQSWPFLCRRGRGHAADPGGAGATQSRPEAGGGVPAGRVVQCGTGMARVAAGPARLERIAREAGGRRTRERRNS